MVRVPCRAEGLYAPDLCAYTHPRPVPSLPCDVPLHAFAYSVLSVHGPTVCGPAAGVIMGVDTLRSAQATAATPGINSILLVRSAMHNSSSAAQAVDYIKNAKRGCPFLVRHLCRCKRTSVS